MLEATKKVFQISQIPKIADVVFSRQADKKGL